MSAIAYPIHEPQTSLRRSVLAYVVFEQNSLAASSTAFLQHNAWIVCVVQDIDNCNPFEAAILKRHAFAVIHAHRDGDCRPLKHVDALKNYAWFQRHYGFGESAIPTSHIQYSVSAC